MTAQRRGRFVAIAGPDGSGKTTAARLLISDYQGPTAYVHFRPSLLGPLLVAPPTWTIAPPHKGSLEPGLHHMALGCLRLARSVLMFWLTYLVRVRPALRRGALVVADRWSYGYIVQPLALRYYGPSWLASALVALTPRPDLVAVLTAPATVIHQRKQELTLPQIEEELERWAGLSAHAPILFDATGPPAGVATSIKKALGDAYVLDEPLDQVDPVNHPYPS